MISTTGGFIPAPLLFKPSQELILKQDVLAGRQSSRRACAPLYPVNDCSAISTHQLSRFGG